MTKDKLNTIVMATLAGAVGALGIGVVTGAGAENGSSSEPVVVRVDQPGDTAALDECPPGTDGVGTTEAAAAAPPATSTATGGNAAAAAAASDADADAGATSTGNEVTIENNNTDVNNNADTNNNQDNNADSNTNNNSNTLTATQAQSLVSTITGGATP